MKCRLLYNIKRFHINVLDNVGCVYFRPSQSFKYNYLQRFYVWTLSKSMWYLDRGQQSSTCTSWEQHKTLLKHAWSNNVHYFHQTQKPLYTRTNKNIQLISHEESKDNSMFSYVTIEYIQYACHVIFISFSGIWYVLPMSMRSNRIVNAWRLKIM